MSGLFDAPTVYAADFEEAWQAYRAPKNSAKFEAYAAWTKTAKMRMHHGAFGQRMLECCRLYSEWIDAENARRQRQRQSDHPKKHFSSWLNGRGWEPYMADAEARISKATIDATKEKVTFDGWEDEAEKMIREIGDGKFAAWFSEVKITRAPTTITFPNRFKAAHAASNFRFAMVRAFGPCTLAAAGTSDRWDI